MFLVLFSRKKLKRRYCFLIDRLMKNTENININDLSLVEKLMVELIFDNKNEYEISLLDYVTTFDEIEKFTSNIVNDLYKAGIEAEEQVLILTKEKKEWFLKIKR